MHSSPTAQPPAIPPPLLVAFALRRPDTGRPFAFPQRFAVALAGMMRHAACQAARECQMDPCLTKSLVAGHTPRGGNPVPRLAYLPLPDIHAGADGHIRHVLFSAPATHANVAISIVRALQGVTLTNRAGHPTARLMPIPLAAPAVAAYLPTSIAASEFATVTPVILPGHDGRDPRRAAKLLSRAWSQAGFLPDALSAFQWLDASPFPGGLPAAAYQRPAHCHRFTCRHVWIRVLGDVSVEPLALGAGRYCGLGLFTPCVEPLGHERSADL